MIAKENITLEEAMNLFEKSSHSNFLWMANQTVFDPKKYGANSIFKTIITSFSSGNLYSVSLFMDGSKRLGINCIGTYTMNCIGTYTSDKLHEKFPNLIKCTGELNIS